jgi:hypothetical protein
MEFMSTPNKGLSMTEGAKSFAPVYSKKKKSAFDPYLFSKAVAKLVATRVQNPEFERVLISDAQMYGIVRDLGLDEGRTIEQVRAWMDRRVSHRYMRAFRRSTVRSKVGWVFTGDKIPFGWPTLSLPDHPLPSTGL